MRYTTKVPQDMKQKKIVQKIRLLKAKTDCSIRILCAKLAFLIVLIGLVCVLVCTLLQRPTTDGFELIATGSAFMTMALGYPHIDKGVKKIKVLLSRISCCT